jgi:hypothetical protein
MPRKTSRPSALVGNVRMGMCLFTSIAFAIAGIAGIAGLAGNADVGLMAAVQRTFPQVSLTRDPKAGDETPRVVLVAFRTLTLIGISRRGDLLESDLAAVAMIFVKRHPSIVSGGV